MISYTMDGIAIEYVIRVEPENGFHWDNKHGNLVAGAKMLFGALAGKPSMIPFRVK